MIIGIDSCTLMQFGILETNIEASFVSLFRRYSLFGTYSKIIINCTVKVFNQIEYTFTLV